MDRRTACWNCSHRQRWGPWLSTVCRSPLVRGTHRRRVETHACTNHQPVPANEGRSPRSVEPFAHPTAAQDATIIEVSLKPTPTTESDNTTLPWKLPPTDTALPFVNHYRHPKGRGQRKSPTHALVFARRPDAVTAGRTVSPRSLRAARNRSPGRHDSRPGWQGR